MFAFARYEHESGRLVLARDRLGINRCTLPRRRGSWPSRGIRPWSTRLEPRHVDLRAFAFAFAFSGHGVALIRGGLTRVALDAGALVVNPSQQGGGKDM